MSKAVLWSVLALSFLLAHADEYHDHDDDPLQKQNPNFNEAENKAEFWKKQAQETLKDHLSRRDNTNVAKNVIMFLGDGMSIPTVAATRMLLGGEEKKLSFESFPHIGLSKTYCVNGQVADSACSSTAYLGGVKGNSGTIGVTGDVNKNMCKEINVPANRVDSIAKWAHDAGKSIGVVTTTRVTHASPAGVYSHTSNRNWENDGEVKKSGGDPAVCPDIAAQMIRNDPGKYFKVVLGGGRREFLPNTVVDEEGAKGVRTDGVNLIDEWKAARGLLGNATYIWNRKQLTSIDTTKTDYVLGLFETTHMLYNLEVKGNTTLEEMEPTLSDLVRLAVKMLEKDKNGYFLFVEGGRIDHGHHNSRAKKALDETVEFSKATQLATELTSESETLIVVTSDHAHVMAYAGYANRGNNIFSTSATGTDGLPIATLAYANGPGFDKHIKDGGRVDFESTSPQSTNHRSPSAAPRSSETHGGDDVGVFARGPWSHLFSGAYEQNLIPHLMGYAACIGEGESACTDAQNHRLRKSICENM